jgi:flagellar motor protein MotB
MVFATQMLNAQAKTEDVQRELEIQRETLSGVPETRRALLEELVDELERRGLKGGPVGSERRHTLDFWYDVDQGVLHFTANRLGFDRGEVDLQPVGQSTLRKVGQALAEVLPRYVVGPGEEAGGWRRAEIDVVLIEGHTDDERLSKRESIVKYGDNWGLSTARARRAWEGLRRDPDTRTLEGLVNSRSHPLFSVAGYADSRPVSEVRDLNRRIDLRFVMVPPESVSTAAGVIRNVQSEVGE